MHNHALPSWPQTYTILNVKLQLNKMGWGHGAKRGPTPMWVAPVDEEGTPRALLPEQRESEQLEVSPFSSKAEGLSHSLRAASGHCLLLYGPQTNNGYHICKRLKKIKRWIIFHDTWKLSEIHISVPINKVLLEQSHARSFTNCLQLSQSLGGRMQYLRQRGEGLQTWNTHHLAHYRKAL